MREENPGNRQDARKLRGRQTEVDGIDKPARAIVRRMAGERQHYPSISNLNFAVQPSLAAQITIVKLEKALARARLWRRSNNYRSLSAQLCFSATSQGRIKLRKQFQTR
jgi:hypothetical protein